MQITKEPLEKQEENWEKNLRVSELTASIDALTGGKFSEEIEKRKKI
jgi:hypothetical protein